MQGMIPVVEPNIQQFQYYVTGELNFSGSKSGFKSYIAVSDIVMKQLPVCVLDNVFSLFSFLAIKRLYTV